MSPQRSSCLLSFFISRPAHADTPNTDSAEARTPFNNIWRALLLSRALLAPIPRLKSAAFRPCDEPEQYPNEAPDKESPTNEEEPSNNEDSADVEESDGPDSHRRSKGESQRDISRGVCDCSISGIFLDAARPEASNEYKDTGKPFLRGLGKLLPTGNWWKD
ncbi:hypothetical protein E4U32_006575 [Claviceps aff. humidiphila group G2b]|nr:hypothetical protein E4U32_006575 [Claviceps aff. humidiphila group G2b]